MSYVTRRRAALSRERPLDTRTLQRAARIIKLLGHPERLKLVQALEAGEHTVQELCHLCRLGQATCSQHLSRLRAARVVAARKNGLWVHYRLVEPKVPLILDCIRRCDLPAS